MYGSSNNPWNAGSASSRFPDLGQASPPLQWQPSQQQQQQPQGYPQGQVHINTGFQSPQPSQFQAGYPSPAAYSQPQQTGMPFQPSSAFGQQQQWQQQQSGYQPQQQQGGYPQQQQQQQQQQHLQPTSNQLPAHLAQFDPYASIGQGQWDGQVPPQQQHQYATGAPPMSPGPQQSPSVSTTGQQHPRDYIRAHKAEIEVWDQYAWKQLLNSFDVLKEAWAKRKLQVEASVKEIMAQVPFASTQGAYFLQQVQQEGARLQGLYKDANLNFDSVAASSFQMHEVLAGYRQSSDAASKRRVREASNAALSGLPDFPPLVY